MACRRSATWPRRSSRTGTCEGPPRLGAGPSLSVPFAALDRHGHPVRWGSERTDPPGVVGARGVVGEVEVEDQAISFHAEIRALDRVEQVATRAVRALPAGRVAEGKEGAPSVALQPVQLQIEGLSGQREPGHREAGEPVRAAVLAAGGDVV